MKNLLTIIFILSLTSVVFSQDKLQICKYWKSRVDPKSKKVGFEPDNSDSRKVMLGIECLLTFQGKTKPGILYGSKANVSQLVPKASIEVGALYRISELFYGNQDFARSVALVSEPAETGGEYNKLYFNRKKYVKTAYESYRRWFRKVEEMGIIEARKQKLDPLTGSGIEWY